MRSTARRCLPPALTLALAFTAFACDDPGPRSAADRALPTDAASTDAAATDAMRTDAADTDPATDAAANDAAATDAAPTDATATDAAATDTTPPDATPPDAALPPCGPRLHFDPADPNWLATPWPDDRHRTPAGHPDLDHTPLPRLGALAPYRALATTLDGFALNSTHAARFDAPLDPATLPSPEATLHPDAAVTLTITSGPRAGQRIPLLLTLPPETDRWIPPDTLLARPMPGYPLTEATHHCLIYTDALRGQDTCPARPSPAFDVRDLPPDAIDVIAPEALAHAIGAACFTTRTITPTLAAATRDAYTRPLPAITTDPPTPSEDWTTLDLHYLAPDYQSGHPPWLEPGTGDLTLAPDGTPITRAEAITARIAYPTAPHATPLRLIHIAFGTGDTLEPDCLRTARRHYQNKPVILACLDHPGLGARQGEFPSSWPDFINPHAMVGILRQSALDRITLQRILAHHLTSEARPDAQLNLDRPVQTTPAAFVGYSQGALVAALIPVLIPDIDRVIIDSGGGLAIEGALSRGDTDQIVDLFSALLGIHPANLDGSHPAVAVLQMLAEPTDPINFAPHWFDRGLAAPDILILSGTEDIKTPPAFMTALAAAAGVPIAEPIYHPSLSHPLRALPPLALPIHANIPVPGGARTAALLQIESNHIVMDQPDARAIAHHFLLGDAPATITTP